MKEKFQAEPNDHEGKDEKFTGMPNAQFPDMEPRQDAEKQVEQFTNTVGKTDRNPQN